MITRLKKTLKTTSKVMGKPLSRMLTTFQSHAPTASKELLEHLKSLGTLVRFQNRTSEIAVLNSKVEDLGLKLSKRNEDFDHLFTEFKQISDREGQFINDNKILQEKNNRLLEQIIDKERLEHTFQMTMSESQNKVLNQMEKLNEQISQPKSASKIGEIGEDFVLECLQTAFPNNTSILRHGENNSGDILFRIENTEKYIMFEVKNLASKVSVSSAKNGKDLAKFFHDLNNPSASFDIYGGVLVSLNGPVDLNAPALVPKFYNGKPYLYIDSMKQQYPDPECLMKVVVHMMTYLIKNSDQMEVENFGLKIENYQRSMKSLMQAYQRLYKNQDTQKKNLELLKSSLDSLNSLFLDDLKEAAKLEEGGKLSLKEDFSRCE